jgi:hypothetical protein
MAQTKKDKELITKVYDDLDFSATAYNNLFDNIKEDFKFAQGEQWNDKDIKALKDAGVKALTINKIKPIIKLITGIERQSRSDFIALPEGAEDEVTGEIATLLMKNITKQSKVELKLSEQFKSGSIGGVSYIEPFMDYSFDLINGVMKFKKLSAVNVYPDPDAKEYDLSDGAFIAKVTRNLTRDQLVEIFPDKEKLIDDMGSGLINFENINGILKTIENREDYEPHFNKEDEIERGNFDLIDYFYKKSTKKYFVAAQEQGLIKELDTKDEAEQLQAQIEGSVIITKMIPVIRHAQVVGPELFDDDVAWSYPRWKKFPLIPYFSEFITENIGDKSLNIQGIVRSIKDLNEEFNKRRTQELRHLNSSANSGFDIEKGQLDPDELRKLKKYGSSPGFVVQRKPNTPPVVRISPMPLSQGHAQLAAENEQDLKEASGVNPDLLATDSKSQSGRAILLKQRQGLVMIQEMLDNLGETKRLTGQFILSQLKEVFTVESALKVLGDAWIQENFTVPVNIILERGLQKVQNDEQPTELEQSIMLQYPQVPANEPIVEGEEGKEQLVTAVDFDTAIQLVNSVLNDAEVGKYDVAIGEGPYSETIRMANFLDLKDLATQGMPIPPDVLIEMSLIPESQKKSIQESLRAQALAQAQLQSQGGGQ